MSERPPPSDTGWTHLPGSLKILAELLAAKLPDQPAGRPIFPEILHAILALGYQIEPPPPTRFGEGAQRITIDHEVAGLLNTLRSSDVLDLADLLAIWQSRKPQKWGSSLDVYQLLGRRLIYLGEPLLACDVLGEGLQHWPEDLQLSQSLALALSRAGVSRRANAILVRLQDKGHTDPETLGLLARTYKDLWEQNPESPQRQEYLDRALEGYVQAHRQVKDDLVTLSWTGINAAIFTLLLGRHTEAYDLARKVEAICLLHVQQSANSGGDPYHPLANLGLVALIRREWDAAQRWFGEAAKHVHGRFGHIKSTRRDARIVLAYYGVDSKQNDSCFHIPPVVAFAGHMTDRPAQAHPCFPAHLESEVRRAIRARLDRLGAGFGYAAGYCGGEILFLEEMLHRGGKAHVVLPFERESFCRDCVDLLPGHDWRSRFLALLERVAEVTTVSKQKLEGAVSAEYCDLIVLGLAGIRAVQLGADLVPMVLWNGREDEGGRSMARVVRLWHHFGHTLDHINLTEIVGPEPASAAATSHPKKEEKLPKSAPGFDAHLMAMLFADAVKFSELSEEQVPRFVKHFLGMIGDLLISASHKPVIKNTWGDGLYFVFRSVKDAGNFALDLSERVLNTRWAEKGLPESLSLRIALHAGPVYACIDPVTGQHNYIGTHVSRAARIEPITPPGHVYASQAFAAMASAERVRDFTLEYVGLTPLPKNAGTLATYHVRRCHG